MRARRRGKEGEARRVWRALVEAFGEVPAERPWVRKAERELEGGKKSKGESFASLRSKVEQRRGQAKRNEVPCLRW